MFDLRRITLFCLEKRLSKHKMSIFSKKCCGGNGPFAPPWVRLCIEMFCAKATLQTSDSSVIPVSVVTAFQLKK